MPASPQVPAGRLSGAPPRPRCGWGSPRSPGASRRGASRESVPRECAQASPQEPAAHLSGAALQPPHGRRRPRSPDTGPTGSRNRTQPHASACISFAAGADRAVEAQPPQPLCSWRRPRSTGAQRTGRRRVNWRCASACAVLAQAAAARLSDAVPQPPRDGGDHEHPAPGRRGIVAELSPALARTPAPPQVPTGYPSAAAAWPTRGLRRRRSTGTQRTGHRRVSQIRASARTSIAVGNGKAVEAQPLGHVAIRADHDHLHSARQSIVGDSISCERAHQHCRGYRSGTRATHALGHLADGADHDHPAPGLQPAGNRRVNWRCASALTSIAVGNG